MKIKIAISLVFACQIIGVLQVANAQEGNNIAIECIKIQNGICMPKGYNKQQIPSMPITVKVMINISPIHVGRRFRIFALKSRFIQNFELGKNNWSLQINGRISKSRFTKISQSRFIFAKVALFKILNCGGIIGHCR